MLYILYIFVYAGLAPFQKRALVSLGSISHYVHWTQATSIGLMQHPYPLLEPPLILPWGAKGTTSIKLYLFKPLLN